MNAYIYKNWCGWYTKHPSNCTHGSRLAVLLWLSINHFARITQDISTAWWRHQMEAVSALPGYWTFVRVTTSHQWIPLPNGSSIAGFDVFFYVSLNKWLNKQSSRRWVETLGCSLWRHCNGHCGNHTVVSAPVKLTWGICGIKKLGQFVMPQTCEKWLGLVNSCVYCACQTREICLVLSYSIDFKARGENQHPLS